MGLKSNVNPQSSSVKYRYGSLKRSYKTPAKNDLTRSILFNRNPRLKLDIIHCILSVRIISIIYEHIHSFPNKLEKFRVYVLINCCCHKPIPRAAPFTFS